MNEELVMFCQESAGDGHWRDIAVPRTPHGAPLAVGEWGDKLADAGMEGRYRAFTAAGHVVAVTITKEHRYHWTARKATG